MAPETLTRDASMAPTPRGLGTVTTFYSFKGGVGRTFVMANVGWLLARWGRRVLCIDWDLEAPGLHRYLAPLAPARRGVLEMIEQVAAGERPEWRHSLEAIQGPWTGGGRLDLISAGLLGEAYADRLQRLDWTQLFNKGLAPALEGLRAEWVQDYDHVLLNARTGVTDIGGICAAQLPDLLAMVFTANHQSLDGTLQVAERARVARAKLPIDRGGFHCVPVAARIHSGEEALLEREWFDRFAELLAPLIDPWRDPSIPTLEYLQHLRVREYARWSFGEPLPVRVEHAADPLLVSWAFANLAALIDRRLVDNGELVRNRRRYVADAAGLAGLQAPVASPSHHYDVFIAHDSKDRTLARALYLRLIALGGRVFFDEESVLPGDDIQGKLSQALANAKIVVVLVSGSHPSSDWMEHEIRPLLENGKTRVIPVYLYLDGKAPSVPAWLQRIAGIRLFDVTLWDVVAMQIMSTLTPLESP